MSAKAASTVQEWAHPDVAELNRFAAAGLVPMLDPQTQLFCHRMVKGAGGMIRDGVSPRYTAMTLLGLHRWQMVGGTSSISIPSVTKSLVSECGWLDNIGDQGLMLWLSSAVTPGAVQGTYQSLNSGAAGDRLAAGDVPTMEAAWLLTGLSYALPHLPRDLQESAKILARLTYGLLAKNQGKGGFFGHRSTNGSMSGYLRGSIGSFADQVYPIYALAQYARSFGHDEALERAQRCADAICSAQGIFGQWWWHYNAASGKVFQRYSVYSVHQDGMAPMALFAVGEATGRDFSEPIYKGLSWIYGNNELGCDMRDPSSGMIWRSVYTQGIRKKTREALDLIGFPKRSASDLRVLHECRPYHFGWLLYAFAGRERYGLRSTGGI